MARSNALRLTDVRDAMRLVGECRDLGRDTPAWLAHALEGLRHLLGANIVIAGISGIGGFRLMSQIRLVVSTGWDSPAQERAAMEYLASEAHLHDPSFERFQALGTPDVTIPPLRLISRKVFGASEYHAVRIGMGIEDFLFSQRTMPNGSASFSFSPQRPPREPYFDARDCKLLRLFHDEMNRLVGTVLADGRADPLADLPPRARQTLAFLLTGDSEKQVALRMGISRHTVHEYTGALYRHFGVNTRAELLAYCLQRRIGGQP
jgi:DNA-binding CsgD family transcriptional regulator